MDINITSNLLDLVTHTDTKYKEIDKVTGFNFNVFEILGLSTAEVRLHSSFIAQLLNPKGKHGQCCIYLELFLDVIKDKVVGGRDAIHLDVNTTRVSVELYIGKQTEEEGGRLDILCQDRNGNKLIIENKIYAPDQKNQILRYRNYDDKALLFYLTLSGYKPTEESLGGKKMDDIDLLLISYEDDITRWLEKCLKESYHLPIIRETIFQYLNTIKKLTNQIENRVMDNEIVNLLIASREKITSAILIEKSLKDAKKQLVKRLGDALFIALERKYSDRTKVELLPNFGTQYQGIKLFPYNSKTIFFQISFLSDFNYCYLEIYNTENIKNGVISRKNEFNLSFFKERLDNECKSLGKIENVKNGWHGDWLCRYSKIDSYFSDGLAWGDFAANNFEIVDVIMKDISPAINAMLEFVNLPSQSNEMA